MSLFVSAEGTPPYSPRLKPGKGLFAVALPSPWQQGFDVLDGLRVG